MRSLVSDRRYYAFLNNMGGETLRHTELVIANLMREFPHLRAEEAKAIWQDWRLSQKNALRKDSVA